MDGVNPCGMGDNELRLVDNGFANEKAFISFL
jgi:hypothetical protein